MGYDVHQLVEGRKLIIGGVEIPFEKGLLGHSDADVLLHAISDALLGAAALGDIGKHFPDTDERYKGAVINEKENKWEVSEKGIHSGRCCPKTDISEKPQYATEENDFWCLANYDRFKGGRKALVEVHGGATLEEVVVPVITIKKKNNSVNCKLVDNKPIMVSFKKKSRLNRTSH